MFTIKQILKHIIIWASVGFIAYCYTTILWGLLEKLAT